MDGPEYLDMIKAGLEEGRRQRRHGDSLLWAFGYVRRRQTAIDWINEELKRRGMMTNPPLTTEMPLDGYISFSLERDAVKNGEEPIPHASEAGTDSRAVPPPPPSTGPAGAALAVGNLQAAGRLQYWVGPDATLDEAMMKLRLGRSTHLAVATDLRAVRGVISYESIARASLHGVCTHVRQCLVIEVPRVNQDASLLSVLELFAQHDVVLVFANDSKLSGLITRADISSEFVEMAAPFFLIGEIEEHLRWLMNGRVKLTSDSSDGGSERIATDVSDLTLGEIERILENPNEWPKARIPYDRKTFCGELDTIRHHRNTVMHFRGKIEPDEVERMRTFAELLRETTAALFERDLASTA